MRKNVTAITAQRPAMWKDDDQGEPDASTISPKAVRNAPNTPSLTPLRRGFFFSGRSGQQRDHLDLGGAAYMLLKRPKEWCRVRDLNSRPTVYKTAALPLS
jgi:hypothetical protein